MNAAPADRWNGMIDELRRSIITGVTVIGSEAWGHPWQVRPRWNGLRKSWVGEIRPGFVNGLDASLRVPMQWAPQETLDRLKAAGTLPGKAEDLVEAWLTEKPAMTLDGWRSIGIDAEPGSGGTNEAGQVVLNYEEVPDYFVKLGVGKPPQVEFNVSGFEAQLSGTFEGDAGKRLLRALDIVLHQDRMTTQTQWTTGTGLDGTFAQFNVVTVQKPGARAEAYLRTRSKWEPVAIDPMRDRLAGGWEGSATDERLLATVYLVSPPDVARGSEPDQTWTPYVAHKFFWNLSHTTNLLRPPLNTEPLTLQTGLAGGVGDAVNQLILAQINDESSAAAQFLGREEIAARFWTV